MLIVGTGGLAKEVLGMIIKYKLSENVIFYDENKATHGLLYDRYKVLHEEKEVKQYFSTYSPEFIVGIGNPRIREKLTLKMRELGGMSTNIISNEAALFQFNDYSTATIIEPFVGISHGLTLGEGCAIHIHSSIGHAAKIGKYVNIGPGATIIGPIEIGDYTYIGAKSLLLPNIKIGKQVVIAAGITVNKDLPDCETFLG
jgi:sugar O-acyltransferase (sialic acid O-acetyltransferase NeuD family)